MDITRAARTALEQAMNAKRLDLGITWREVSVRAGVAYETVRNLRAGPSGVDQLTLRKLDKALGWDGGHLEKIAAKASRARFTDEQNGLMQAFPDAADDAIDDADGDDEADGENGA
jgi:hypothetical protein